MKLFYFTYYENRPLRNLIIGYIWAKDWAEFGKELALLEKDIELVIDTCGLVWTNGEVMTTGYFSWEEVRDFEQEIRTVMKKWEEL